MWRECKLFAGTAHVRAQDASTRECLEGKAGSVSRLGIRKTGAIPQLLLVMLFYSFYWL